MLCSCKHETYAFPQTISQALSFKRAKVLPITSKHFSSKSYSFLVHPITLTTLADYHKIGKTVIIKPLPSQGAINLSSLDNQAVAGLIYLFIPSTASVTKEIHLIDYSCGFHNKMIVPTSPKSNVFQTSASEHVNSS